MQIYYRIHGFRLPPSNCANVTKIGPRWALADHCGQAGEPTAGVSVSTDHVIFRPTPNQRSCACSLAHSGPRPLHKVTGQASGLPNSPRAPPSFRVGIPGARRAPLLPCSPPRTRHAPMRPQRGGLPNHTAASVATRTGCSGLRGCGHGHVATAEVAGRRFPRSKAAVWDHHEL